MLNSKKKLISAMLLTIGITFCTQVFGQEMDQGEAELAAKILATKRTVHGGLGCSKAVIAKTDTVDIYNSGELRSLFRVVLYADCIPCLHVYMFNKKSGKKVFDQSILLKDKTSYAQTCVIDRERYLD